MLKEVRKKVAIAHHNLMLEKHGEEINNSITASKVYREHNFEETQETSSCKPKVVDMTTEKAVFNLDNPCVLNFASFTRAGGGFIKGSIAQEEALCHASNLYEVLMSFQENEYNENYLHHMNNSLYKDWAIYSPNIVFFNKNHKGEETTHTANVITCACPNFTRYSEEDDVSLEKYLKALEKRIKYVLDIAKDNGCKEIILGAFGCGVFGNDPKIVADIFQKELKKYDFETVLFAIPKSAKNKNYEVFHEIFSKC